MSTSTAVESPLLTSYARLAGVYPWLRVQAGPPRTGDGWLPTARMLQDPAALGELIALDARQSRSEHGVEPRPDVAAGFCLHRYVWPVTLLFTLPWLLERRVPHLPADRVAVRRSTGELSFLPGEFSCLPEDPAAGLPDARVAPDEAALRARLRAALAGHLTPVLAAFRPRVRRGPHTLWAMATDDLIEGLWYVGSLLGEEERAVADLNELLTDPAPEPFTGAPGFRRLGTGMRTRTRFSCCLYYTVRPGESCFGCPRKGGCVR